MLPDHKNQASFLSIKLTQWPEIEVMEITSRAEGLKLNSWFKWTVLANRENFWYLEQPICHGN